MKIFILFFVLVSQAFAKAPVAQLDHVYILLPDKIFEKLSQSKLLNQDGLFFKQLNKKVVSGESSWVGSYYHGKKGYIEFFPESRLKTMNWLKPIGFGFAVEKSNTLEEIHKQLPASKKGKFEENKFEFYQNGMGKHTVSWTDHMHLWITEFADKKGSKDISREMNTKLIMKKAKWEKSPSVDHFTLVAFRTNKTAIELMEKLLTVAGFKLKKSEQKAEFTNGEVKLIGTITNDNQGPEFVEMEGDFEKFNQGEEELGPIKILVSKNKLRIDFQ